MTPELYLYSGIYDGVAEDLMSKMEAVEGDLNMRINSPGGSVFSGWGIIAKIQERAKRGYKTNGKLDGAAMSMAAMILAFLDSVEALDVSTVMLHRADMWIRNAEDQAFLDGVNKQLRAKLESKISNDLLKEVTGKTFDDLFDAKDRIDLFLTASQAKKLGLITKITKVNPQELTAFNDHLFKIAATASPDTTKKQNITMKLDELKASHPALFEEVLAQGKTEGEKVERERVKACLAWLDTDKETVLAMVKEGKTVGPTEISDFSAKAANKGKLKDITADGEKNKDVKNPEGTTTTTATEEEAKVKAENIKKFRESYKSHM